MLSTSVVFYANEPIDLMAQCLHFAPEEECFLSFVFLLGFVYFHLV